MFRSELALTGTLECLKVHMKEFFFTETWTTVRRFERYILLFDRTKISRDI